MDSTNPIIPTLQQQPIIQATGQPSIGPSSLTIGQHSNIITPNNNNNPTTINVITNPTNSSNTTTITSNGSTLINPNNNTSNVIPKPIITTIQTPHIQQQQQQQQSQLQPNRSNTTNNPPPPPVFQVQVPGPLQQSTSSSHSPSPNMSSSSSSHNVTPTYNFSTPSHHHHQQQQQQHHNDTSGFALSDFLMQLEDYTPTIPDAVANYYLHMVGFDSTDPRMSRLISIAAQKFISDIINEAFTHCKLKGQAQTGGSKTKSKEKKYVLTMEDLIPILNEYGITVKKPPYYV